RHWNDTNGPFREVSAQHGFLLGLISLTYAGHPENEGVAGGRGARFVLGGGRVASSLAVSGEPAGRRPRARGRYSAAGTDHGRPQADRGRGRPDGPRGRGDAPPRG